MKSFYGIKDTFPENLLFTRSVGAKMISFVNKTVRDYAMDFDNKGRRLHLVNVGLKVFEKIQDPVLIAHTDCNKMALRHCYHI